MPDDDQHNHEDINTFLCTSPDLRILKPEKSRYPEILIEYVTSQGAVRPSTRKLAEKHGIAHRTLRAAASREGWLAKRDSYWAATIPASRKAHYEALFEYHVRQIAKDIPDLALAREKVIEAIEAGGQTVRVFSKITGDVVEYKVDWTPRDLKALQDALSVNIRTTRSVLMMNPEDVPKDISAEDLKGINFDEASEETILALAVKARDVLARKGGRAIKAGGGRGQKD